MESMPMAVSLASAALTAAAASSTMANALSPSESAVPSTTLPSTTVPIVYVARGDRCSLSTLHSTLHALANVAAASRAQERLRFIILASGACLDAAVSAPIEEVAAAAGITSPLPSVDVVNGSDARFREVLSPEFAVWLDHPRLPTKTRTYFMPKLALCEILSCFKRKGVHLDEAHCGSAIGRDGSRRCWRARNQPTRSRQSS